MLFYATDVLVIAPFASSDIISGICMCVFH